MIRACMQCASRDLDIPKLKDGIIPETDNLAEWVCRVCGLKAVPLEFQEAADYEAFRDALTR